MVEDLTLLAIDIVGLYPSVLHDEGIQALAEDFDKSKGQITLTESLILLAECILKINNFECSSRFF